MLDVPMGAMDKMTDIWIDVMDRWMDLCMDGINTWDGYMDGCDGFKVQTSTTKYNNRKLEH